MKKVVCLLLVFLFVGACIEPFEVDTDNINFEDVLVVEATITDELMQHKILLSRSTPLNINLVLEDEVDENGNDVPILETPVTYERNANVVVVGSDGNRYEFFESSPGTYISNDAFSAQKDITYSLEINTTNGQSYTSNPEGFTTNNPISSVYPVRELNDEGVEGVFIYVDGGNATDEIGYFRYTYEETYKIIAPFWKKEDFVLSNYDPCALPVITYDLEIIERLNEEGKVCYQTESSTAILQESTADFEQNQIQRFPVRFIDRSNFIISHRYSILVKQYTQTIEAFNYYEDLKNFSSSDNIFSETQPGFLEGNVKSNTTDEKVIGFFEVASVTERRMFFNYEDLFGQEPLPEYPIPCTELGPPLDHISYCFMGMNSNQCPQSIVEAVNVGAIAYDDINEGDVGVCPGPYVVRNRACGDCTILGKSEVPSFWTD